MSDLKEQVDTVLNRLEQAGFELTDVEIKEDEITRKGADGLKLYMTLPIELTFRKPEAD